MRAGRDPTRRNKNIGTADHSWRDKPGGRVPFGVPWPRWDPRHPSARWAQTEESAREVHGRELTIVTEPLNDGHRHVCHPDDVCAVLACLPESDVKGLALVVLRQPTRKEQTFDLNWGCIHWSVDFRGYSGPAVTLDATDFRRPWLRWGRSLSPYWQRDLERLRSFGFSVRETRRSYDIELVAEPIRRWMLALVVPHEVGHWVDFRRRVLDPLGVHAGRDALRHPGYEALVERWRQRPKREVEEFADRYADAVRNAILECIDG